MIVDMVRRNRSRLGDRRQHGAVQHRDRRELENEGWRTTLEYRENHVRSRDGRLQQLRVEWHAVAERAGGSDAVVISACGSTVDKVWSRLRLQAELATVKTSASKSPELVAPEAAGAPIRAPGPRIAAV